MWLVATVLDRAALYQIMSDSHGSLWFPSVSWRGMNNCQVYSLHLGVGLSCELQYVCNMWPRQPTRTKCRFLTKHLALLGLRTHCTVVIIWNTLTSILDEAMKVASYEKKEQTSGCAFHCLVSSVRLTWHYVSNWHSSKVSSLDRPAILDSTKFIIKYLIGKMYNWRKKEPLKSQVWYENN